MRSSANRYTLYGALFGAFFPIFATLLAAYLAHDALGWRGIVEVQRELPLLWIIDSAPFWLGLFARFGGVQLDRLQAAHERLRASEQRFRSVVDSLGEGVLLTSVDGRVTYANSRAVTLLGERGGSLDGRHLQELLGVPADEMENSLSTAGAGGYRTVELRPAETAATLVEVRRSRVVSPCGGGAEVAAVLTDVTLRHQLEEQLRQAQKMEAVGKLAGGIAHDFNNMLTAIIGFAALLESEMDAADERRGYASEIGRAAARSAELTQQLLAFGRKQVLQPRVLDFDEVLRAMEPMLRRLIGADILLAVRRHGALPPVLADPGQLEQVVLNLVVNARDAMRDGGRLVLETRKVNLEAGLARLDGELAPGAYVLLRVADTGCGMDRATMERIFDPFFTTKPVGEGTGLGLSTVYGIVKQSGGHIEAESVPGRGSAFQVYLPCAKLPDSADEDAATARVPDGVPQAVTHT